MRRVICMLLAVLLCLGLVAPMVAGAEVYVPSNGADLNTATVNDVDVLECLEVTSVPEAEKKSTNIEQGERDDLVVAYDELADEVMKLITQGNPRYLDLMGIHFAVDSKCEDMLQELKKDGVTLDVTLNMQVDPGMSVVALSYIDGQWHAVPEVTNNNDGTVSCKLEDEGPVVFIAVNTEYLEGNPGAEFLTENTDETVTGSKSEFVPSVTYKDSPKIVDVDTNMVINGTDWSGDGIDECIVVTNVTKAKQKTTDITQEARDELVQVYEALADGTMTLPLKEGYVVRELVDISFKHEGCIQVEDHGSKDENLAKDGTTVTIVFDMDLEPDEEIVVLTYIGDEWIQVEDVTNNGDGTLTCVFEDLCPVAFAVENVQKAATDNPNSGDPMAKTMGIWVGLMAVCAVGIVVLVVSMNRKRR